MRLHRSLALTLLLAAPALACTPAPPEDADPISSLSSPAPSATFGAEYWSAQASGATENWQEAVELCSEDGHRRLPNCQSVGHVHFLKMLHDSAKPISSAYDGKSGVPLPGALAKVLDESGNSEEIPEE